MPKTLVVFYSLTGFTKIAAEELARSGGWEIAEIRDVHSRKGLWSKSQCLIESSFGLNPRIDYRRPDPGGYDFVLLGAPVWGFHIASPLRSFFAHHRNQLKRIAFFFTFGGGGADNVTRQAGKLLGSTDVQILLLKDSEIESGSFRGRISDFVGDLRTLGA
jgi:flavodoxin